LIEFDKKDSLFLFSNREEEGGGNNTESVRPPALPMVADGDLLELSCPFTQAGTDTTKYERSPSSKTEKKGI